MRHTAMAASLSGLLLFTVGCGTDERAQDGAVAGVVQPNLGKVVVEAYRFGQRVAAAGAVETDGRGSFALQGLSAGLEYELRFRHPEWVLPNVVVVAGAAEAPARVDPPAVPSETKTLRVELASVGIIAEELRVELSVADPTSGALVRGLEFVPGVFAATAQPESGVGIEIPAELFAVEALPDAAGYRLRLPLAARVLPVAGVLEVRTGFPGAALSGAASASYTTR